MLVAWTKEAAAGRKKRGQTEEIFKETGAEDEWTWGHKERERRILNFPVVELETRIQSENLI